MLPMRAELPTIAMMTILGHHENMKKALVSEFKAHLSEYLRGVRQGQSVTIFDRDKAVAQVVPIRGAQPVFVPATGPRKKLRPIRGVKDVDSLVALRQERGDR